MSKNFENKILDKIEEIENKVNAINSREVREKQFRLLLYSMIGAAIVSLVISTSIRLLDQIFPGSSLLSIGGLIILSSLYGIVFLVIAIKSHFSIGNYEVACKFDSQQSKEIFKMILGNKFLNLNDFIIKRIHPNPRGFHWFSYIYDTTGEKYEKKIIYLRKNFQHMKELEWTLRKKTGTNYSSINLDLDNGNLEFSLYSKNFTNAEAQGILNRIRRFDKRKILKITKTEAF